MAAWSALRAPLLAFMRARLPAFRWARLFALFCALLCALLAPAQVTAQESGPLHITSASMMAVPSKAFGPVADTVDASSLPGPWSQVELPHSFFGLKLAPGSPAGESPILTRWYRIDLDQSNPQLVHNNTTHLYMLRWQVAGQITVYGDGQLLYRSRGSPLWNIFRHPALFVPLNRTAHATLPRTLLIRVDALRGTNGAISSLWVGDSDALYWRYAAREWLEYQLPFMSSAAFLALAFFALAVWVARRHETIYFLFFITAVLTVTRRFHFYADLEQLPISDAWFGWITVNSVMMGTAILHFFFYHLHQVRQRISSIIVAAIAALCAIFTLPLPIFAPSMVHVRPYIFFLVIVMAVVIVTMGWIRSARVRSREGILLAIGYSLGIGAGIFDYFKQTTLLIPMESFFLTPYAAMALFATYTYVMYRRYIGAIGEVEQVNAGLGMRLAERERELSESYARLREIEQREMLSQERRRLMQDMHDGLGSSLMTALRVVEHGKMNETSVAEVLKSCVDDLKLTIDSMEPVEADLLLLLATLRFRLGPRLENSGVSLRWEVQDVPAITWLDPRNALHILRILQEAFTNVIKHTRATEIIVSTSVHMEGREKGVLVSIIDNGGGFDAEQAMRAGGKGLPNQNRRAQSIGARVRWHSESGGTRFTLWLPARTPAPDTAAAD